MMTDLMDGQQGRHAAIEPRTRAPSSLTTASPHGAFDITVVSDGYITLPAAVILPDAAPGEQPGILKRLGGDAQSAPFPANTP